MNKKILATACLLVSVSAQPSELDDLVNASSALVNQIDTGIQFVSAAEQLNWANNYYIAPSGMQESAYISQAQADAYNDALGNIENFVAYTAVEFFNDRGESELELMNTAIDTFTEVVVDMSTVVQVSEMAVEAQETDNVQKQEDLQDFVAANETMLEVTQEDIETYNTSLDEVAEHAANAAAYLTVAGNEDAAGFIQQGADDAGERFTNENNNLNFNQASGLVSVQWESVGYGSGVFLNGQGGFGIDVYLTEAEILALGGDTEFYMTGPTAQGYDCFFGLSSDCDYMDPPPVQPEMP